MASLAVGLLEMTAIFSIGRCVIDRSAVLGELCEAGAIVNIGLLVCRPRVWMKDDRAVLQLEELKKPRVKAFSEMTLAAKNQSFGGGAKMLAKNKGKLPKVW